MPRWHSYGIAMATMALATAAGGCGGDDRGPAPAQAKPKPAAAAETKEQRQAREHAQRFLLAMADRDDARACAMMTRKLRAGIDFNLERRALPGSCRTRAAHIFSSAKAPGHPGASVKSVLVTGGSATATATAPGGIESEIRLRKDGGRWQISDF